MVTHTKRRWTKKLTQPSGSQRREVDFPELTSILEASRNAPLTEEQFQILKAAVETLAFLTEELARKGATIKKLQKMLFGPSTEKSDKVCPAAAAQEGGEDGQPLAPSETPSGGEGSEADPATADKEAPPKKRRKGASHGRNGASDYKGARKVAVSLDNMKSGDPCPECPKGKVYPLAEPKVLILVRGMAPLDASVYELERFRCSSCGEIFTAPLPEGVKPDKYDETATGMIVLFRYSAGLPFNRLEKLQQCLQIPKAPTHCSSPGYGIGSPCGDPPVSPSGWAAA